MRNTSKSRTIPRSLPKGSRSKAYKGKTTVSQPLRCQLPTASQPLRRQLPTASQPLRCQLPTASHPLRCQLPTASQPLRCQLPTASQLLRCQPADCLPAAQMPAADCLPAAETSISGAAHRKLTFQTQGPAAPGLASNLYIIPQNARKENGERGESHSFSRKRSSLPRPAFNA